MKKLIIFLQMAFFLLLTIFFQASASTWRYEWSNSIVHIPVGESLEKYKYLPTAMLYKDNIVRMDAEITYLREGDWLCYLSNVNTSVIGEYEVWYKAYENKNYRPGTCPGYKCKVKFIVEDKEAPKVELLEETVRLRRKSEFDPFQNIRAWDNYDEEVKLSYFTDMDSSKIGKYEVKIYAEDSSANHAEISYYVEVFENNAPTIEYIGHQGILSVPLGDDGDISHYFKASDEIEGDISNCIEYPYIDTSKVGREFYVISVTNGAGLVASKTIEVNIVDDSAPVIELTHEKILLDYKTNFTFFDFMQYKKNIIDNSPIQLENFTYTHNIRNEVGTYLVTYRYTDMTYTVTKNLEVQLVSYDKPIIQVEPVKVFCHDKVDLREYIEVTDLSDTHILDSLEIYDEDVDYNTAGTYYAEVYVINSSGLSASKKMKIIVEERYESNSATEVVETKTGYFILENKGYIIFIGILLGVIGVLCFFMFKIKKKKTI